MPQTESHKSRRGVEWAWVLVAVALLAGAHPAQAEESKDLTELSLEELMNMPVTMVSRKEKKLSDSAAAIHVITQEDIRRSGATSIPDALRMVPGMMVASIDANKWAVSSRGYMDRYATKLLVLVDGRTVYTPVFSGVYWDMRDTLMEEVERIEVIRGPGAALWGANAVNGIINIITKNAKNSQGLMVNGSVGTERLGSAALRYGGKLGADSHFRVWSKYFKWDNRVDALGRETNDNWNSLVGGFRTDLQLSQSDTLSVIGDGQDGENSQRTSLFVLGSPFTRIVDNKLKSSAGSLLSRWKHSFSPESEMAVQAYYDYTLREDVVSRELVNTYDLDFQHYFTLGDRNAFVWGVGYRWMEDYLSPTAFVTITPDRRTFDLASAFIQDEITLIRERLFLTIGSKFEHNDFSGGESQPNARLLWTPHSQHQIWSAVSRAVRTPSRSERDLRFNFQARSRSGNPPINLIVLFGSKFYVSEVLTAYEGGYRVQPTPKINLDLAGFYFNYDQLRTFETKSPFNEAIPAPNHRVTPQLYDNKLKGQSYGGEVAVNWEATHWWKIMTAYSHFQLQLQKDGTSNDSSNVDDFNDFPRHVFHARMYFDLPWNLEFDPALYYMSRQPGKDISEFERFDARLGWHPLKALEISVAVQNILDDQHQEFPVSAGIDHPTHVQRSILAKATWKY